MFVKRLSLRFRLALIFAIGSLATLLVVTGILYFAFRHEIRARNRQTLDAKIQEIASILIHRPDDSAALEEELVGESNPSNSPVLWCRVVKGTTTITETNGMADQIPTDWLSRQRKGKGKRNHRRYLISEQIVGEQRIQGALDVTEDEHLIDSYWRRLVYAMLLGAGGCAALGWWSAHRGLRPLREIADSTRGISAHRLQDRLDPRQVPPELGDLVQALNAMLDRLNQAFERLSRFSSDLAHELRTPITILMGEAEVVLSRDRSDEEYRQVLESSLEEYRRLSRLISRMLFLARAEDPSAVIEVAPIDAKRLVEEVLGYFEAVAEEQEVHLQGEGTGSLHGDADMIRQALANLVSNALEATPKDGRISIRVKAVSGHSELEVQDSGRGIAEEELPRILNRFYRTRDALDRNRPGTGLGLAIVQSIARLHQGELKIASELGKGTSAILRIPA